MATVIEPLACGVWKGQLITHFNLAPLTSEASPFGLCMSRTNVLVLRSRYCRAVAMSSQHWYRDRG